MGGDCIKCYLQVTGGDVVPSDEWLLDVDNVIDTTVGVEGSLDFVEGYEGTVSSATTELALGSESGGETNGIVEGETKRLVHLLTTLATVEEVLLNIVEDGEQGTAGCVSCGSAICTSCLANESS